MSQLPASTILLYFIHGALSSVIYMSVVVVNNKYGCVSEFSLINPLLGSVADRQFLPNEMCSYTFSKYSPGKRLNSYLSSCYLSPCLFFFMQDDDSSSRNSQVSIINKTIV